MQVASRIKINKRSIINYLLMILFSSAIIALEIIFFHLLLIVTNYINATFIISIAIFGISAGSFVGYYFLRIDSRIIITLSSVLFLFSIVFSYFNIVNIEQFQYPIYLVFPFFLGSIIISSLFSRENSNYIYFTNLAASALGVILPVVFVSHFKSENSLILLMFFPVLALLILGFSYKSLILKIAYGVCALGVGIAVLALFLQNTGLPYTIPAEDFESVLKEVQPEFQQLFLKKVYAKPENDANYHFKGDRYDLMRSNLLLGDMGYKKIYDLNFDIKPGKKINGLSKAFASFKKSKLVFSQDSLVGRVELTTSDDKLFALIVNGVALDIFSPYPGIFNDPRFPYVKNSNTFIVGLSADGICKSVAAHKPKKMSGIEINPVILEIMDERSSISPLAGSPYKGFTVYKGEGRHFLESNRENYDMITLMNIHAEHSTISTLAPEFFHTVEGTELLLSKLTSRGYVVYEEILVNKRAQLFFKKFLNTVLRAMKQLGIKDPLQNILVYEWDFWSERNVFKTLLLKRDPFTSEELKSFEKHFKSFKDYHPVVLYEPGKSLGTEMESFLTSPYESMVNPPTVITTMEFVQNFIEKTKSEEDLKLLLANFLPNRNYTHYYLRQKIKKEVQDKLDGIFKRVDYPYEVDLSPITDDKPFPFNVFTKKLEVLKLFKIILILVGVFLIPIILRIVFEFRWKSLKVSLHFVFFALIGFAYMLVEIVLMQQFQRFIGAPTYALIITLGGLLFFSGIGSLVSKFFPRILLNLFIFAIPVTLILYHFFITDLFNLFGQASFNAKLILSVTFLFPITFLMGFPFPNALERIKTAASKDYGTLMFGVSGAFSTLGSISSILISTTYGFSASFLIGIVIYTAAAGFFMLLDLKWFSTI